MSILGIQCRIVSTIPQTYVFTMALRLSCFCARSSTNLFQCSRYAGYTDFEQYVLPVAVVPDD